MRGRSIGLSVGILIATAVACAALRAHAPGQEAIQAVRSEGLQGIELKPPTDRSLLVDIENYRAPRIRRGEIGVFAYEYASHVYERPQRKPVTLGLVRRGTLLRAAKRVSGPGCKQGSWYALKSSGYACAGQGFTINPGTLAKRRQLRPNLTHALPFKYGKVNTRSALRYWRIPDADEERAIESAQRDGRPLPDVVQQQLDGDYFVAIDRVEISGKRSFYRTVPGRYVLKDEVDIKPAPTMRGELLHGKMRLPLAFVYGEPKVPVYKKKHGTAAVVGDAYKHARFAVAREAHWGEHDVVVSRRGFAVDREHVRVARKRARPSDIEKGAKWIHINLDEQTLVAYRGDRPLFATLVSTGREGHDTPAGLFRIHEKHKTTTMRGEDPGDGPFEVAEVPWTMFYWGNYALHGAYWHDDFGEVRSHGCTNLAPTDARWLFHFTDGHVPAGWHALRELEGTQVYLTRGD